MKANSFRAVLLAIGITGAFGAPPASATTYDLGDLIAANGSITVGDKLFYNFTCVFSGAAGGAPCDEINVNTLDSLNYGIQFQGAFAALQNQTRDWLLGYDVLVLDPQRLIKDAEMLFNGNFIGDASYAEVVETITNLDPIAGVLNALLASFAVTNPPLDLSNNVDLAFLTTNLHVQKDMQLGGGPNIGDRATVSFVDQRWSQIPEPTSLALLGLALAGLGVMRRRNQA